ncbi:hypothetical protein IMG5_125130, partial [Ichthyophthirius multifiliis]
VKESAHSVKGSFGYLKPLILDQISNELQNFIKKRLTDNLPFTDEDVLYIYQQGLVVLTEYIAFKRFVKKTFNIDIDLHELKSQIDECYKVYFKICNIQTDNISLKQQISQKDQKDNNKLDKTKSKENMIFKQSSLKDNSAKDLSLKESSIKERKVKESSKKFIEN